MALFLWLPPGGILPVLWIAALVAWLWLRSQPAQALAAQPARFYWRALFNLLLRVFVVAILLLLALKVHRPQWLFSFPRSSPSFWALVMTAYPLLSALPQAILYRWLFEYRYASIFSTPFTSWLIGSLVFGFAHLPFGNLWAIGLPFLGGLVFLRTYRKSGSLILSWLEHSLYGDLIFTIGWGAYLYHGGTQAILR